MWWEGIDGSRIFTHFPPVDTYNATLAPAELHHTATNFRDKGRAQSSLVPYGYGGGGPTREMIEQARRSADLAGSPQVRIADPDDFFAQAMAEYVDAPTWVGELYLELHRGTFTSQVEVKRTNRVSESLLHSAEAWSAIAATRAGHPYPYEELQRIWRDVLLFQFHDILPGSSIAWVYREVVARAEQLHRDNGRAPHFGAGPYCVAAPALRCPRLAIADCNTPSAPGLAGHFRADPNRARAERRRASSDYFC